MKTGATIYGGDILRVYPVKVEDGAVWLDTRDPPAAEHTHWLKTWSAVRDEVSAGLPAGARTAMLAAVNRLLAVRFKQRHALRIARQARGYVGKED